VIGKTVSHARSVHYQLELPAWGPRTTQNSVEVPYRVFVAIRTGDPVCISLHPGALGAPWFKLGLCPAAPNIS
jgi:hypothetical protein